MNQEVKFLLCAANDGAEFYKNDDVSERVKEAYTPSAEAAIVRKTCVALVEALRRQGMTIDPRTEEELLAYHSFVENQKEMYRMCMNQAARDLSAEKEKTP